VGWRTILLEDKLASLSHLIFISLHDILHHQDVSVDFLNLFGIEGEGGWA
jgi:hypothetical protein